MQCVGRMKTDKKSVKRQPRALVARDLMKVSGGAGAAGDCFDRHPPPLGYPANRKRKKPPFVLGYPAGNPVILGYPAKRS